MFLGIQFQDCAGGDIALIHKKWLTPRKSEVWWPPYKIQDTFDKALKKGESPLDNWELYKIEKTLFEEGDLKKAKLKIKKAEYTSDITSGDGGTEIIPSKRTRIRPKRLFSDSSDDSLDSPPAKIASISSVLKLRQDIKNTLHHTPITPSTSQKSKTGNIEETQISCISTHSPRFEVVPQLSALKDPQNCALPQSASQVGRDKEPTPQGNFSDFERKVINLLVTIKNQNRDIKNLILQNIKDLAVDLPTDFPVNIPLLVSTDVDSLESYLEEEEKLSIVILYFSRLGGKDVTNKTNLILRRLMSNELAVNYSYLGSRQDKKAFKSLKLNKVVIRAVLSGTNASEREVEDAIKSWLKHAPKRLRKKD